MTTTTTIDVQDRLDEINQRLEDLRGEIGRVESEAEDVDEDSDEWVELDDQYRELRAAEQELLHAREEVSTAIEQWGGSEFEIAKFDAGRQAERNDLVTHDMLENQSDRPEANLGASKLRTVQVGLVSTPPESPGHPSEYPPPIFEFIYDRIENYNTYGDSEVSLEDFSLAASQSDENSPSH